MMPIEVNNIKIVNQKIYRRCYYNNKFCQFKSRPFYDDVAIYCIFEGKCNQQNEDGYLPLE